MPVFGEKGGRRGGSKWGSQPGLACPRRACVRDGHSRSLRASGCALDGSVCICLSKDADHRATMRNLSLLCGTYFFPCGMFGFMRNSGSIFVLEDAGGHLPPELFRITVAAISEFLKPRKQRACDLSLLRHRGEPGR